MVATPLTARCWCCSATLTARYLPHVRVLECVACGAGSTVADTLPVIDTDVRCVCGKYLGQSMARPWWLRCPRCKEVMVSPV